MVAPTSVNGLTASFIVRATGPFADHDVELEVLHRGIKNLLDHAREAMDLVDEQHVALFEVRDDRRKIAGALDRRPRGRAHVDAAARAR